LGSDEEPKEGTMKKVSYQTSNISTECMEFTEGLPGCDAVRSDMQALPTSEWGLVRRWGGNCKEQEDPV
jgi:hypothetical protein